MVNVSNEYLDKINSLSKQVYWFGKITLKNGTEYEFDVSNLAQGQTSIRKELCPNKFGVGGTCSAELKIAFMLEYDADSDTYLLNGLIVNRYDFYEAEISLNFRLFISDDEEWYEDIALGTFVVTESERTRLILNCTAYDFMMKLSKSCVSEIQGTPYNILISACSICGIELGNTYQEITTMINGTRTVAEYDPKNQIQTWRDVIGFLAGMMCGNAIIKYDKLYIIPFKDIADRFIDSGQRIKLTLEDYSISYGTMTAINLRNNTEDKVKVDEDGLNYNFGSNPLMQYTVNTARIDLLKRILTVLHDLKFVAFDSEIFCDPSIELGDVIEFTENHAESSTKCIVTAIELRVNGHMNISCEGDDPYYKQTEKSASDSYSESTSGQVGDGVTFYDYVNSEDVIITDGEEVEICSITYDSNGILRQEFATELKIGVLTAEQSTDSAYTNNDLDITATYYLNGQEIAEYHPQTTYTDGVFLMHLMYFWSEDKRIPESTFSVTLTVNGGSLTILEGNNHSRIMQSGTSYADASNALSYIDVTKEPDKVMYRMGEHLDYTGLVISAFYEDGHSEDITSQCTFNPAEGTEVTSRSYINVKVNYTLGEKNYITSFGLDTDPILYIEVTKPPNKEKYDADGVKVEYLDYTGMVVTAFYDENKTKDITKNCTFDPPQGTQVTPQMGSYVNLKIHYEEYGQKYNTNYNIILYHVAYIEVKNQPTQVSYMVGDNLNTAGLKVVAVDTEDVERDVTNICTYSLYNGQKIKEEDDTITVTFDYAGKTFKDYYYLTLDIPFPVFPHLIYGASKTMREVYVYAIDYISLVLNNVEEYYLPAKLVDEYSQIEYDVINMRVIASPDYETLGENAYIFEWTDGQ